MQLERLLRAPHERRLAEVRRLTSRAGPPAPAESVAEVEAEERLRVAMVRLIPRAEASDEACALLLRALEGLWSTARADVRALDAWHNAYEVAIERGLDPERPEFRTFLARYAALLEWWVDPTP